MPKYRVVVKYVDGSTLEENCGTSETTAYIRYAAGVVNDKVEEVTLLRNREAVERGTYSHEKKLVDAVAKDSFEKGRDQGRQEMYEEAAGPSL